MAYILHIDTATEIAQVGLAKAGNLIASTAHAEQKDHAGFLQPAIAALLQQSGIGFSQLAAVALTDGPGSYTGLRVGMASAKGLCYALQIPLITVGTLTLMAASALEQAGPLPPDTLLCPMIDARRMEVFTAIFTEKLEETMPPTALVLEAGSLTDAFRGQPVYCFGSGSEKFRPICPPGVAFLEHFNISMPVFAQLSSQLYENQQFRSTAYAEPAYNKAFFSTQKRQ
jgi:tRNA threonylcarbamoyladenosine biosynthesis protein TsaB